MTRTKEVVRTLIGRRRRISRDEMKSLLVALHAAGLDLANGYVFDSQKSPDLAATAWAKAVNDITVISASMDGWLRDGQVRYDQPGSMNPMQKAEVMFISDEMSKDDRWNVGYFCRTHAHITIVVDAGEAKAKLSETESCAT